MNTFPTYYKSKANEQYLGIIIIVKSKHYIQSRFRIVSTKNTERIFQWILFWKTNKYIWLINNKSMILPFITNIRQSLSCNYGQFLKTDINTFCSNNHTTQKVHPRSYFIIFIRSLLCPTLGCGLNNRNVILLSLVLANCLYPSKVILPFSIFSVIYEEEQS